MPAAKNKKETNARRGPAFPIDRRSRAAPRVFNFVYVPEKVPEKVTGTYFYLLININGIYFNDITTYPLCRRLLFPTPCEIRTNG